MQIFLSALGGLVAINAFTLLAFGWDKAAARNGGRRTPESTLLGLALIGGSIGAIAGQQIFRHKTRKEPFRSRLVAIASLHLGLCLISTGYVVAMIAQRFIAIQGW